MDDFTYLSKLIIFSTKDVIEYKENKSTAYSLLQRLQKDNKIKKIRNNLYSCVNPATDSIYASKYQIGSSISETSFISHTSALEYYGLNNQVSNSVYVSSLTKFNTFEFEGITYQYQPTNTDLLVNEPKYTDKIRISDLERSVIDSIKEMEKIAGVEEVLSNLSISGILNVEKLKKYLDYNNIQSLYKRVGFILSLYESQNKLPTNFFEYCKEKSSNTTIYLTKDAKQQGSFNKEWNLIVTNNLMYFINHQYDEH